MNKSYLFKTKKTDITQEVALRKTKRRWAVLLLCLLLLTPTFAQTKDTTAIAEHQNKWNEVLKESRNNPAFMQDAFNTSITRMGINFEHRDANRHFQLETGNGHSLVNARVASYLRLDKHNTVWGGASYQIGKKRNIRFNSTSDYELLYPYVMADTIGGNIENEQYAFNGGYAVKLNQWTFGAKLDFRAEHEYRTIDPRPRGISTDITLRLGLAYDLQRYRLGVGIGGRTYKQTNNVDFYNPLGVIPEFHMTGLGTDYVRFAGAVRSAYYKGTGYIVDFQLTPLQESGCYASIEENYMPYQNILTELNALPISQLNVYQTNAQIGWKHSGRLNWTAYSGVNYENRKGNEHIAGSSSSTEYKSLITLSMFSNRKTDLHIGGGLNMGTKHCITLDARFGFIDEKSEYVDLKREMAFTKSYGKLSGQWLWRSNTHWLFEWNGNAAYYHNNSKRIIMPYACMDKQITQLVNETYTAKTEHLWRLATQIQICHTPEKWKGVGLFLNFGSEYSHTPTIHQIEINSSAGIVF